MAAILTDPQTAPKKTMRPFWADHPEKFWSGHEVSAMLIFFEWPTAELGSISLAKFVARFSAGLPEDLPQEIVKKLIAQAIDVFEKSTAAALEKID